MGEGALLLGGAVAAAAAGLAVVTAAWSRVRIDSPHAGRCGQSYAYCERLARREAGNFYHAFRLLPADQRRAMCALYAFMRIADDLTDGAGAVADKRAPLDDWRRQLHAAPGRRLPPPAAPGPARTPSRASASRRATSRRCSTASSMDLDVDRYETFADLYRYCYRVASAVGLACIHIWGFRGDAGRRPRRGGRHRLPADEHPARPGRGRRPRPGLPAARGPATASATPRTSLRRGVRDERFRELMRFEAERAYGYYDAAEAAGRRCCARRAGRCSWSCCGPTAACSTRSCAATTTSSAAASA